LANPPESDGRLNALVEEIESRLVEEGIHVGAIAESGHVSDPALLLLLRGMAAEIAHTRRGLERRIDGLQEFFFRSLTGISNVTRPAQVLLACDVRDGIAEIDPDLEVLAEAKEGEVEFHPPYTMQMGAVRLQAAYYCDAGQIFDLSACVRKAGRPVHLSSNLSGGASKHRLHLALSLDLTQLPARIPLAIVPNLPRLRVVRRRTGDLDWFRRAIMEGTWHVPGALETRLASSDVLQSAAEALSGGVIADALARRVHMREHFLRRCCQEHEYGEFLFLLKREVLEQAMADTLPDELQDRVDSTRLPEGTRWVTLELPRRPPSDPEDLFYLLDVNAFLAVGYRTAVRQRVSFDHSQYDRGRETLEIPIGGQSEALRLLRSKKCITEAVTVAGVSSEFRHVFASLGRSHHWFDWLVDEDGASLIIRVPRHDMERADAVTFQLAEVIGARGNESRIATEPRNRSEYKNLDAVRALMGPSDGGTEETDDRADMATDLGLFLRNQDRIVTAGDIESFVHLAEPRVSRLHFEHAAVRQHGRIVAGTRVHLHFEPSASLPEEEKHQICASIERQLRPRLVLGTCLDIVPAADGSK